MKGRDRARRDRPRDPGARYPLTIDPHEVLHEVLHEALGDRYDLEDVIGVGGMGAVYRARDRKHDRPVAIKTSRPDLTTEGVRNRFQREIRITARLQHPHILALLDSGLIGEMLYYVMPYIEGESLETRLEREGKLPAEEVVRIATDVAEGLEAAHEQAIVHRDIKPGNIMLTARYALIMDFGIAKAFAGTGDGLITIRRRFQPSGTRARPETETNCKGAA